MTPSLARDFFFLPLLPHSFCFPFSFLFLPFFLPQCLIFIQPWMLLSEINTLDCPWQLLEKYSVFCGDLGLHSLTQILCRDSNMRLEHMRLERFLTPCMKLWNAALVDRHRWASTKHCFLSHEPHGLHSGVDHRIVNFTMDNFVFCSGKLFAMSGDMVSCHHWGRGYSWNLQDRD